MYSNTFKFKYYIYIYFIQYPLITRLIKGVEPCRTNQPIDFVFSVTNRTPSV